MSNSPQTILVVDDDASVRQSLSGLLRAHGYGVVVAGSASEALRVALAQQPDVIIMDLVMPGGSGLNAIRNLRSHAHLASVPAIALTASPIIPDDATSLFQRILMKPCGTSDLLSAIRAVTQP